ncbi:glycosylase [bacterium]|nr:glycosylase [bacterium]
MPQFIRKIFAAALIVSCASFGLFATADENPVPRGLYEFTPSGSNPVFTGGGNDQWDKSIRERGWVMFEDGLYHLWYTGYAAGDGLRQLGYATSPDGIHWVRHSANPLSGESWVEDMSVVKFDGAYYMMAEGFHDWAHLLISKNKTTWKELGSITINNPDGTPIADPKDPDSHAGTPVLWRENGVWYLLFEHNDEAIWLATTTETPPLHFTKTQDDPVLSPGPDDYDKVAVAADSIIKIQGTYYLYYHATGQKPWGNWCVCLATSKDLIHWKKHGENPVGYYGDAPILVFNGKDYRFFVTDSPKDMRLYLPVEAVPQPDAIKQ